MAKFKSGGLDDAISDFDNIDDIPYTCDCSVCGLQFEASQKELLRSIVTCTHCGAELSEA